ncbi:hypothetical protein CVE27_22565 [Pseudomonas syringae pv. actinidiae]|nr:hypothetical protein [Pseudomonas syringae pv. actinidiae]NAT04170.1 hypothetical protein [Pseudomonas syringae pv. actinidiae]NAT08826.1 hypothetical protein [Pseudomonas syringae pv. actinidiae]NAT44837.1 hypothetical protein [Pseudomonas syringae pv. actinidiae]
MSLVPAPEATLPHSASALTARVNSTRSPISALVMFQSLNYQVVPNVVEERADIHLQCPVLTTAPDGTLTQGIVGRSSGPVPAPAAPDGGAGPGPR